MSALILVVDDEPKIMRLVRDYLEKDGFRVLTAVDGLSALAMARHEKPDLIVLDLLLPGMDGREVCRTLRAESSVPIIMLTALSGETDQIVGLELGADDYIIKPFSPVPWLRACAPSCAAYRAGSKHPRSSAQEAWKLILKNTLLHGKATHFA
jgi:DNA-binding response OmpR family regulator